MYYYQASIKVEKGKKIYGDLPELFTVGYENEETQTVYFPLLQKLDEQYTDVYEINEELYEQELSEINRLANEKRVADFEETKNKIIKRQQELESLKRENNLLKAQNQALTDRTDFHEEVLTEIILAIAP